MKVRTALVGLGRMGRIHCQNLWRHPQVELHAVCSQDESDGTWVQNRRPDVDFYESLESLLSQKASDLDCVFIATPSYLHPVQIETCLQHGLHVFCEKPVAIDEPGCRRLEALAERFPDKKVMVGFMRRFDPPYQELKRRVKEGVLGVPILFRAYSCDPVALIDSYLPYADHGAGHFLDMSIHDIDLMHWLLPRRATSSISLGGVYKYPVLAQHGGDGATAVLTLDGGTVAFFYTSRLATQGYWVETELVGTDETMRVCDASGVHFGSGKSTAAAITHWEPDFEKRFRAAFENEVDYFIRAILDDSQVEPSWAAGIQATRTAIQMEENFRMISKGKK